jgi:hypothetical protein
MQRGAQGDGRQQQHLRLQDVPEAWLRLLINTPDLLNMYYRDLTRLLCTNRATRYAVLRCMHKWRLEVKVRGPGAARRMGSISARENVMPQLRLSGSAPSASPLPAVEQAVHATPAFVVARGADGGSPATLAA